MGLTHVVHGLGLLAAIRVVGAIPMPLSALGACWPLETTPGGHVQIGTGDLAFEPMPDVLPIVHGAAQSDPYLEVHARIQGIHAWDPVTRLDLMNSEHEGIGCCLRTVAPPAQDCSSLMMARSTDDGDTAPTRSLVSKYIDSRDKHQNGTGCEALELGLSCPARLGYGVSGRSTPYDLAHSIHAYFGTTPLVRLAVGSKQM